ncbi:acyl-ACP--UDP-N-acetylglucosamine O-acyltransferase [Desulfobacca acetoxidans]|uniref:Acyl-[acyl-carrier-protein]--UDP-N-acetylglucosamine O-acyltransferase n=1 Tax=Desulfobacca acetoxidans (strain ATCC 700848 / DSM 11109 / ASRB2) TaxID=880072 RepID=F2NIQ4_DESAR|nr:acyl-ACP--UDP-N-acetylglucosamine O-acyltransferase [Desulfobacca acetoxidans]AEB10529.1 Acyl-(acyl-carrier-protein)--UDP-N-acetylglucosamine O-acyltransferase [Desulfobacca acetoxidans DSM 11109]HAY23333.1 acyl-ACP--UDP-N-acetylglucosamine O-acyltransferase [Desulfobacterales bacterium]
MPDVHSSAIVHSDAQLAAGVSVGPYSIIDANVVIGADTKVGPHVVIRPYTTIGERCNIFQFAVIGEIPQDLKFQGEETRLVIGNDNTIREFATLHRGTAGGGGLTQVGDGNLLMAYTHVAHDCSVGNHVIMSNAATLAGHISVDDHAIIGGLSAIHQFCQIGAYAFVGGCSAVARDIPPFCMAIGNRAKIVGLNLVGLKRHGFTSATLEALKSAYEILFASGLTLKEGIVQVRQRFPAEPAIHKMLQFLESSERGLAPIDVRENRSHRGKE